MAKIISFELYNRPDRDISDTALGYMSNIQNRDRDIFLDRERLREKERKREKGGLTEKESRVLSVQILKSAVCTDDS